MVTSEAASEAFIEYLVHKGLVSASSAGSIISNGGGQASWEVVKSQGLLTENQVDELLFELCAQRPELFNAAASSAPSNGQVQALTATDLQDAEPPKPAWGSSGEFSVPNSCSNLSTVTSGEIPPVLETPTVAVEAGVREIRTLSAADLVDGDDYEYDAYATPTPSATPLAAIGALDDADAAFLDVAASNGFGSRDKLRDALIKREPMEAALGISLAPGRVLLEFGLLAQEEVRQVIKLQTGELPEEDHSALVSTLPGADADLWERRVERGRVKGDALAKAKRSQQALALIGIDRPLHSLAKHFSTTVKPSRRRGSRNTSSSRLASASRQGSARHARRSGPARSKDPVAAYCVVAFFVSLFIVVLLFGEFSGPPQGRRRASAGPVKEQIVYVDEPALVSDAIHEESPDAPRAVPATARAYGSAVRTPESPKPGPRPMDSGPSPKTSDEPMAPVPESEDPGLGAATPPAFQEGRMLIAAALADWKKGDFKAAGRKADKARAALAQVGESSLAKKAERLSGDISSFLGMQPDLVNAINSGAVKGVEVSVGSGMKGRPWRCTSAGIEFKVDIGGRVDLQWNQLKSSDYFRLLFAMPRKPRQSLALGALSFLEDLAEIGHKTLRHLWISNRDLRPEITERLRPYVPPGEQGYVFKSGRFEPKGAPTGTPLAPNPRPAEQGPTPHPPNATLAGLVSRIVKLARGDEDGPISASWDMLQPQLGGLATADRSRLEKSLKRRRAKALRSAASFLKKSSASKTRAKLKIELNRRREFALAGIFDKQLYPDANHGAAGQPEIDKRVGSVQELWDRPINEVGKAPKLKAIRGRVRLVTGWLKELTGKKPAGESFKDVFQQFKDKIGVRGFATDVGETAVMDYNAKVRYFNKKFQGVSESCREQIRILNDYRIMLGLRALAINLKLYNAAQKHSLWMKDSGNFSHTSTIPGLAQPWDRARSAGYPSKMVGENIARGQSTPAAAHRGWYTSSGHHRNMLSRSFFEVGVGKEGVFWTQLLGGSRPALR